MATIRNIIFDLGGVVIDLKREHAVKALRELGVDDADDLLGLYKQSGLFLRLETGDITAAGFFDEIRSLIVKYGRKPVVDDTVIEEAFDRFLVGLPTERLAAIRRMRSLGFRTFVLSNTNPVMFDGWIKQAFRAEGMQINDYFDGVVTSFQEGMCKPNPELFKVPLHRYNLVPEETVMLDDSQANCDGASRVGMQSIRITTDPSGDLLAVLQRLADGR